MLLPHNVAEQETFVTFSFAPIIDGSSTVAGAMGACVDVSENVIGSRRLAMLHRLGSAAPTVRTLEAIGTTLAGALRDNPDIRSAALYLADARPPLALSWIHGSEDDRGLPGETAVGTIARVLETEESVELTAEAHRALALPLRGGRGVIGVLVCAVSEHLPLDDAYRAFLELVAAHVSAMLAGVTEPQITHPVVGTPQHLRTQDAFLSVVAHELRNPLSALMTTVQSLMVRTPSTDVELMERSVRRLSQIVDNLLDVSRLARGRLELSPRSTELANVIDRAMELVAPLTAERNVQLFVRVARGGLRITADPERIAQAIASLLSNAIRFSDPGSRVWLQAERAYDRARIVIRDEGSGIEPERLAVVFETFSQAPESRPRTAGVGLGLAIARSVVRAHGGELTLRNRPGGGLLATITLP